MKFRFHPEAEVELNDAADWYESQQAGLGCDFAREVRFAIQRAMAMPEAWPQIAPDVRRVLPHRFPYGILYTAVADGLLVLAVMNLRRKPGY